jgi:predicted phosphoribosyltransferase
MFVDRIDAGRKLAKALSSYRNKNVIIIAIPRGGVAVATQVAAELDADLSLIIVRKLPFPDNPEAGFGAIAEDGSSFIIKRVADSLGRVQLERIKQQQQQEIRRRQKVLRPNPMPDIKGRTVILVDDGIAMGSTMRAAIISCKRQGAGKIVIASPVAGNPIAKDLKQEVDEAVILEQPRFFQAVAQSYQHWHDVSDQEVTDTLKRFSTGYN